MNYTKFERWCLWFSWWHYRTWMIRVLPHYHPWVSRPIPNFQSWVAGAKPLLVNLSVGLAISTTGLAIILLLWLIEYLRGTL